MPNHSQVIGISPYNRLLSSAINYLKPVSVIYCETVNSWAFIRSICYLCIQLHHHLLYWDCSHHLYLYQLKPLDLNSFLFFHLYQFSFLLLLHVGYRVCNLISNLQPRKLESEWSVYIQVQRTID